jgi:hypothetical protein
MLALDRQTNVAGLNQQITSFSSYIYGTGYDYPDLPGLGNNNEKLGLPEKLSTRIQFRATFVCLSKASIWIPNFICRGLFCVQ